MAMPATGGVTDEVMALSGIVNAAPRDQLDPHGDLAGRTVVAAAPELLILGGEETSGSARAYTILHHPALEALKGGLMEHAVLTPLLCPGPWSVDAARNLRRSGAQGPRACAGGGAELNFPDATVKGNAGENPAAAPATVSGKSAWPLVLRDARLGGLLRTGKAMRAKEPPSQETCRRVSSIRAAGVLPAEFVRDTDGSGDEAGPRMDDTVSFLRIASSVTGAARA